MMNFALKTMNFALKMMDVFINNDGIPPFEKYLHKTILRLLKASAILPGAVLHHKMMNSVF